MRILTVAVLMAICVLGVTTLYAADRPITIALVLDDATDAEREPLLAYLTKAMGRPVVLARPASLRETVAHLADGSYDFASLGALAYIQAHTKYGVIPLVQRAYDVHFRSVFITGAGSSISSLSDLKGKQLAFSDVNSTSARLIDYGELKQAGLNPEVDLKIRYSGSYPATAALVETGVVDAGTVDETILNSLIRDGKLDGKKIRIFYKSRPYVSSLYVARKDVPQVEREKFANALLALKESKDALVLRALRARKFVVATDEEYASTRQIAHELNIF